MAKKFIRKDAHKKKRLALVWRKPKGITNKQRLQRLGHAIRVKVGFGTKKEDRNKNKQGLMIVTVATLAELQKINPKTQAALLAGVGKKRKMELIAEAQKHKITLVNFNSKLYEEKAKKFMEEKKKISEKKKEKEVIKEKEQKQVEKKAEKTEEKEELSLEEKKKEEKEEKDKILTKK
jgi:large subunit ribosomal protein L32e